MTDGKAHEVRIAKRGIPEKFDFPAGSIVVFDRGDAPTLSFSTGDAMRGSSL